MSVALRTVTGSAPETRMDLSGGSGGVARAGGPWLGWTARGSAGYGLPLARNESDLETQGAAERGQCAESGVGAAAFDAADVGLADTRQPGEPCLREALLAPVGHQLVGEAIALVEGGQLRQRRR